MLCPTELALRLPSAICGFLTAMMLLVFCWKYYGRFWLGFMAAIIVSTSQTYINYHGARNGEYEMMFIFFSTLYLLCMLRYYEKASPKYL